MSRVKITGNASGTGILTIEAPNTNTNRTLTLPDEVGTVLTSASTAVYPKGGPAFYATAPSNSAPSTSTWTKVTVTTEVFDTANCYSSSRFTPNVAGYYAINASAQVNGSLTSGYMDFALYKNGSKYGQDIFGFNSVSYAHAGSSNLMYLNGTTDYVELYVFATQSIGTSKITFGGFLARAD